jgi:hypothetical protein
MPFCFASMHAFAKHIKTSICAMHVALQRVQQCNQGCFVWNAHASQPNPLLSVQTTFYAGHGDVMCRGVLAGKLQAF